MCQGVNFNTAHHVPHTSGKGESHERGDQMNPVAVHGTLLVALFSKTSSLNLLDSVGGVLIYGK